MTTEPDLVPLRAAIVGAFPELAAGAFRLLAAGWDSMAVDVDDRLIFKFPRDEEAADALVREARLLARIRPAVRMPVPDPIVHAGPPLFSRHTKLKGDHLLALDYERLPEDVRQRLGADLARFYADIHGLDAAEMAAVGAQPITAWERPADALVCALSVLPGELRGLVERTVAAWEGLPPDPHGTTYGFFDGHGWNMAFDHANGQLNGVYDFADSGLGPLHQDFIYSNFISPDLTARIVTAYETLTGRVLDRRRIATLTGAHRLWELAEAAANTPQHVPLMVQHVAAWAAAS